MNLNDNFLVEKPIRTALDSSQSENRNKCLNLTYLHFEQPSDIEARLRELLGDSEAILFDLLFIMTVVRRKYNKHYLSLIGNF